MEPIMSCPQGHTLSGKMCTIAPTLSCPAGYTLVNGMCQPESGVQGYGDSMNIPPSENMMLRSGDLVMPPPGSVAMVGSPKPPTAIISEVAGRVAAEFPDMGMRMGSPKPIISEVAGRVAAEFPKIEAPSMGMGMGSPKPMTPQILPGSEPSCPSGYSLNKSDNMCYPL